MKPCSGHIVLVFESMTNLNYDQVQYLHRFFGQRLFAPDYFNNYVRLSFAYREFDDLIVARNFGTMHSLKDVKFCLEHEIAEWGNEYDPLSLEGGLIDFAGLNLRSNPNDDIVTAAFFVSGTQGLDVEFLAARAKDIQDQGIRLVFIATGDKADVDVLTQIVGSSNLVFTYDITKQVQDDYRNWFNKVINC
ncbi:hypothetical protein M3Y97_01049100 [Aphelenchoides bicaudatus]|nr:hypothetical protein M3Y97_01049100 [Aphelenchoides bicaudatus]